MKNTHFEPRYILTLPLTPQVRSTTHTVQLTHTQIHKISLHTHLHTHSHTHAHTHTHICTHTHPHTRAQVHAQRMRSSGQYSEEEIEAAVADVVVYQQSHQDRPGFFDTAINTGPSIGQIMTHTLLYNTQQQ